MSLERRAITHYEEAKEGDRATNDTHVVADAPKPGNRFLSDTLAADERNCGNIAEGVSALWTRSEMLGSAK
jgi:hypothetical protein